MLQERGFTMLASWNKLTNPVKIVIVVVLLIIFCCCSFLIFGSLLNAGETTANPETESVDVGQIQTQAVQTAQAEAGQQSQAEDKPTAEPTNTPEPTATVLPTATVDPNILRQGMYLVNTEIQPGIYKGNDPFCYWARLSDLTGSFGSILANDNAEGQFYLEIKETDYAFEVKCQVSRMVEMPAANPNPPTSLPEGTYLVNIDIKPGNYKGNGEMCYWERLSSVSGEFGSIIANDNGQGQFYVQVLPTDFAIKTKCPLEWVSD